MLKILTKIKVILVLLLVLAFSILLILIKVDYLKNPIFLELLNKKIFTQLNKISQTLAQEYTPYFFPHFPQRLIYLLSSINSLTEELIELNEELINQLNETDCSVAFSQCLPKIIFGGTGCQPANVFGSPLKNIKEIEEKKEEIADNLDTLLFLKELLQKEMENGLSQELATLKNQQMAEDLKNNLEKVLKRSEEIITVAKENQNLYSKDYTEKCIAQCQSGPVCGIKACAILGTGPQKQININAKIEVSLDDLDLGKVGINKFNLALPEKLQFPQIGDITLTFPSQTLNICFPFESIAISTDLPSFTNANLPSLSFTCPKLPWNLKLPQLSIPKLPKEIKIPFPKIPEIKFCPEISEIPLREELERIRQELIEASQKDIGNFKDKIDEAISEINSLINKAPESTREEVEKYKQELEQYKNEIIKEYTRIPEETKTPAGEFQTPGPSQEYQYQSPQSQGLELKDISLSYQCGQTSGDKEINTKAETNWYSATLSWLMENCANLPTMSSRLGLQQKASNCYNPDKVVKTIIDECKTLWNTYCAFSDTENLSTQDFPAICIKIGYSCNLNKDIASAIQCQNLFKQEGLAIPSECLYIEADYYYDEYNSYYYCSRSDYPTLSDKFCLHKNFNPVLTLKNKCQQLKNKYPKDPPEACKVLPLFTEKIEAPGTETHYGTLSSCPAQTLLNLPFGFGSGLGFNCSIGLPSLPKIVLPDIVIPDIILPEFSIPPFFRVKLPKLIIEDLILPDIELCDLNNCANVFPSLYFKLPYLKLPSFNISTPLPKVPGLNLSTKIDFPEINFSLPQINLFNLLLPELKLPQILIPSPKINFAITGIDVSAIFDYIFTFILNAMDVSDFNYCLTFKIPAKFLSITFPDYYFSFKKFPEIPKIPFCKDIRNFCKQVENALGANGWLKKADEIEAEFNKIIDKIQKELDKINIAAEKVQTVIDEVFKEVYGEIIYNAIIDQLKNKGLSLQDYINPKTQEIDLNKIPFPGVFPVKTIESERECLPVSVPEVNLILKIGKYSEMKIEKKLSPPPIQFIIYVPVDIHSEIPIPWPDNLKDINLINPLTYSLPKIPLSDLNYKKEFPIKGPGFQPRTFHFDFGTSNQGDCLAKPPTGGNPFPMEEIRNKLNTIKNIKKELDNSSQEVIEILE